MGSRLQHADQVFWWSRLLHREDAASAEDATIPTPDEIGWVNSFVNVFIINWPARFHWHHLI